MKKYDVARIREAFAALSQRANESLSSFDKGSSGIGRWHLLTATDNVDILYVSPSENGARRTREHPVHGSAA